MMDRILWRGAELAKALNVEVPETLAIKTIAIDSRKAAPGALFVALKGDHQDGHAFVNDAFRHGAAAALVRQDWTGAADGPLIRVPDPLSALQTLAAARVATHPAKRFAVTGSSGKTGTVRLLAESLKAFGQSYASPKSYNNHLGLPLTLASLPPETDYITLEIGMDKAGEIQTLTQLAQPHAALITTVGLAHLENFSSPEGIAHAKAEIFEGLSGPKIAIIPTDIEYFDVVSRAAHDFAGQVITFGASAVADITMRNITQSAAGQRVTYEVFGEKVTVELHQPGAHWAQNAGAILALHRALGHDLQQAATSLSQNITLDGRGEVHTLPHPHGGQVTLIDDSYNANPQSMAAALETLIARPVEGRRLLLLADMKELGAQTPDFHKTLIPAITNVEAAKIYLVGEHMAALAQDPRLAQTAEIISNTEGLAATLWQELAPGDTLLAKGSNSLGLGQVISDLRRLAEQARPNPQAHAL